METNILTSEKSKIKVKRPKHYKVIMHNDDYTTMEFVVYILMNVFKKSAEEANRIMLDVHQRGRGIAGIYPYDIAATKVAAAMTEAEKEGFPFKLTIEEE
ncbi:ATP-dependent Clp protease adaptor ClpS [Clostridium thermarum]|uniref:ATP-dependent Clp protease adaptor ClpS n=1 Tax=Clostridium thermarum TaxID=1716543 RepID=UPI00111D851A|nr:ATP-dependent Clp protease adaptor ClpS [Clostridium thermarum]